MKKSLTMPKKSKGGPFGIFQHPICRKTPEKLKPFAEFFSKESRTLSKKLKGGSFSFARYCMLRGKRKTFLIHFPGPTGTTL